MTIKIICQKPAIRCPVANQPEKKNGVVHGMLTPVVRGRIPITVAIMDKMVLTSGVARNGTNIIGLSTTGSPKIIISLIPKIPGTMAKRPKVFIRLDLAIPTMRKTKAKVEPPPPKLVKKLLKPLVKMLGNGKPFLKASKFSVVRARPIGVKTVLVTAGPLIPKNQKKVDRNWVSGSRKTLRPIPKSGACRLV